VERKIDAEVGVGGEAEGDAKEFARKEGGRSVSRGEGPVRRESAGNGGKGEGREDAEDDGADAESPAPAMGECPHGGSPRRTTRRVRGTSGTLK
jgi:hypothetical protein